MAKRSGAIRNKPLRSKASKGSNKGLSRFFNWQLLPFGLIAFACMCGYYFFIYSATSFKAPVKYYQIKSTVSIRELSDSLSEKKLLKNGFLLRLMAEFRNVEKVKPGLYRLEQGWSNYQVVSHFKDFTPTTPKKVELKSYRFRRKTIDKLCKQFSHDHADEVFALMSNKDFAKKMGFDEDRIFSILLPGTYLWPKDLDAEDIVKALCSEYENFWNEERQQKAADLGLNPDEAVVLASIVYSETKLKAEMPRIAGVYINRLGMGMKLQSDPTLVYANEKFGTRRVRFQDKKVNSKYNTYMVEGLPPGPIHTTPLYVIDEVLKAENHNYIYFCAKSDFSGCHVFSESFDEHKKIAVKYRKALDKAGIR